MSKYVDDVAEFHRALGVPIEERPTESTVERRVLRSRLIIEEASELMGAIAHSDLIGIADGIVDLIYVTVGAAHEFGLPLDELWDEVHRSNMAKVGGPIREDGKVLKPAGWRPPDVAGVVARARAESTVPFKSDAQRCEMIAARVLDELGRRVGFDQLLAEIDDEVRVELLRALRDIVLDGTR